MQRCDQRITFDFYWIVTYEFVLQQSQYFTSSFSITPTKHARTHACTHAHAHTHMHARARAHTHTHTHTLPQHCRIEKKATKLAFKTEQLKQERALANQFHTAAVV